MDGSWFDNLARRQATRASRRQVVKGLMAGLAGVAAVGTVATRVTAAATCAGSHKVCTDTPCCDGFVCNEQHICIAPTCTEQGGSCESNDQCCFGYICGETKTCITSAECANEGGGCGGADEICCGDLVCGAGNLCVAPGGSTDSGDTGGTTTLPNTGAGSRPATDNHLAEGALAAGAAAVVGGLLVRDRLQRDPE